MELVLCCLCRFCLKCTILRLVSHYLQQALHEELDNVSWLVGKWKGEGCGVYPTIAPFMYGEEMIFDHVGQPMLSYK